jgi:hypothetical protein
MLGAVAVNGQSADEIVNVPLPGSILRIDHSFGRQPLAFEPNVGQTDAEVKFLARGKGYQLFLTETEAVMVMGSPNASEAAERLGARQPSAALWDGFGFCENREFTELSNTFESGAGAPRSKTLTSGLDAPGSVECSPSPLHSRVLRMRLVGANDSPQVKGDAELPGKVNYFIGNDPARWHKNVPTFGRVQLAGVYPGVDLVYYGNEGRLEYDFVLSPGAEPNQIALEFDGADRIELDAHGDLIAWVAGREVRWQKPVVYQEFDGQRIEVAGAYRLDGGSLTYQAKGSHRIGFELAAYDRSQPLVIDPVLVYSSFLGGSGNEGYPYGAASSIVSDSQGNAYVVGHTDSLDFTITNALQSVVGGINDAFVAKLSPSGELLFSTYLGGAVGTGPFDFASGVALDTAGNIHIAGHTLSEDFPLVGPLQSAFGGEWDAFVTILSYDGAEIRFSTYWGGTHAEAFYSVALDPSGNIYLTGLATEGEGESNTDFPVHNALQPQYRGSGDAVVVKLSAGGTGVVYSTYLGGSRGEGGGCIVADAEGFAYIAGSTDSFNLPVTNAYQPRFTADGPGAGYYYDNMFYARITPHGSALSYCSYFAAKGYHRFEGLALGPHGDLWLTGQVDYQQSGLATPGAFLTSVPLDSYFKSIVARFNATNGMLAAATYLDRGVPHDIAVDAAGNAWVAGTALENLPLVDPLQAYSGEVSGRGDGFVAKISSDCSGLLFSTYFGGTEEDSISSLCLAPNGDVLLFGQTKSVTDFPLLNAFQPQLRGEGDTFVARISMGAALKMSRSGQTVILSWPIGATNFVLEAATSLPAGSWATVTNSPTVTATERSVQFPVTGDARFFRLRKE